MMQVADFLRQQKQQLGLQNTAVIDGDEDDIECLPLAEGRSGTEVHGRPPSVA